QNNAMDNLTSKEGSTIIRKGDENVKDGTVKIEHGKIIVKNPLNNGSFPTIYTEPPLKLKIDNQIITTKRIVSEESIIEWYIDEMPLYDITVSDDKLSAFLKINRLERYVWTLLNQEASNHIIVRCEQSPIVLESLDFEEIMKQIDLLSIKMNIDVACIQKEIIQPSFQPVVIAKGKPPIQGQDARLEMYFSENVEDYFSEVGGLVDYKNHMKIPSVNRGDLIAKKIPLVEGKSAYDGYGNILLPEPVEDIKIAVKKNVELTADNNIIALKEGRPRISGNKIKYFDINTSYIVPGNVDLKTGNIVFSGDVIVYGDVMDNM